MAIKERLLKQLDIVRDGLNAMPPFHSRDLNAMRNALVQARDLCFHGLSEKHLAEYKDTYDGLLLAIDQLAADAPDQGEIVSLCSELLQYTITQTQKETTFKKEIFFLPYKASMWDSLESVWKAADEDKEHCIAYVMPIPYADLTPEHTVAEWHCEREMFPPNVPTLDWQTVNLEEMHPDVIFIHNPYDQYNRVTSVESRYYSAKLKACTDKLVYIPYFVLDDMTSLDGENISGFILAPAVLNADEVIVQSEKMRQAYINVLVRHTDQKNRANWEKRILGLGSPKIDKVMLAKKEDYPLPKAWEKQIAGRKIILYNTSLNAYLQNPDHIIGKLQEVLAFFKKRTDIAFWWRPHPLMEATLVSMIPSVVDNYRKIRDQFVQENWGIYDDTQELERAIVWSDGYYGDSSSVAHLYQKTGKSVLIQDISNKSSSLRFDNLILDGEVGFALEMTHQALYQLDFQNQTSKRLAFIPVEYWTGCYGYSVISKVNDKLIILPFFANKILEYDIRENIFTVAVIQDGYTLRSTSAFSHCIKYSHYIFFLGTYCPTIIRYDTETGCYKSIDQWFSQVEHLLPLLTAPCVENQLIKDYCMVGNKLFFALGCANLVLEMDMETCAFKVHAVGADTVKYQNIDFCGRYFWLVPQQGLNIVRWQYDTGETKLYPISAKHVCSMFEKTHGVGEKLFAGLPFKMEITDDMAEKMEHPCMFLTVGNSNEIRYYISLDDSAYKGYRYCCCGNRLVLVLQKADGTEANYTFLQDDFIGSFPEDKQMYSETGTSLVEYMATGFAKRSKEIKHVTSIGKGIYRIINMSENCERA